MIAQTWFACVCVCVHMRACVRAYAFPKISAELQSTNEAQHTVLLLLEALMLTTSSARALASSLSCALSLSRARARSLSRSRSSAFSLCTASLALALLFLARARPLSYQKLSLLRMAHPALQVVDAVALYDLEEIDARVQKYQPRVKREASNIKAGDFC